MKLILILSLLTSFTIYAKKERVIYKYKKYQKFDFDDLLIEGESGEPGDLTIDRRYQYRFKNKLPYRRTFTPEIRKAVERTR